MPTAGCVALAATLVLLMVCGCASGPPIDLPKPEIDFRPDPDGFRAGAFAVDITPRLGYPLWGHSTEGAKRAQGAWTRLQARALAFEDAQGRRLAIVQLDLGGISALIHRRIALELQRYGVASHNLVLLASHTHGGPGGFFGARFYNRFAAGRCGFFPELVEGLVRDVTMAVVKAFDDLRPAAIAAGESSGAGLTRNRSLEPWCLNFSPCSQAPYQNGLRPLIRLLRVDQVDRVSGDQTPLAALVLFPAHATAVSAETTLYHGDVHGAGARLLAAQIQQHYSLQHPIVAAIAAGPEGDVSPNWTHQSVPEARRLARRLGNEAFQLFRSLSPIRNVAIRTSYAEARLPGARTSEGVVCDRALVGVPTLGGAEDGRSFLYGHFGVYEGRKRDEPKGCHAEKVLAFGCLQRLLIKKRDFPRFAPVQLVELGDEFVLGSLPGEATTETGRLTERLIHRSRPNAKIVAIAGLANDYLSYFTTASEYTAQHYEGGSTIYGPATRAFLGERMEELARHPARDYDGRRFQPGRPKSPSATCPTWTPEDEEFDVQCRLGRISEVGFTWSSSRKTHLCPVPEARVICDNNPLSGAFGQHEDSDWIHFELSVAKKRRWTAAWTRDSADVPALANCKVVVSTSGHTLRSRLFGDSEC